MRSKTQNIVTSKTGSVLTAAIVCALLGALSHAAPQSKEKAASPSQKTFATPDEAAKALIEAATNYDVPALLQILGPDGKDLVATEDPAQDKIRATAFAALAREKSSVSVDSTHHRADLLVGKDDWPMPIPIVKQKNGTLVLRFRLRAHGGAIPAHRRERTEHYSSLPWFCRGAARVRFDQA